MQAINVWSPSAGVYDSYGRLASNLANGLRALGVHANLIGAGASEEFKSPIVPVLGGFLLGYPTNFKDFGIFAQSSTRIAMTMFESTVLPPGWTEELNICDSVIVPSEWLINVFRANGVESELACIPLGISEKYSFKRRSFQPPFKFVAIGDGGRRKGWLTAVMAFHDAFGDDMNYQLTIKMRDDSVKHKSSNPNISIIEEDMEECELIKLYHQHQFMICPTRGEGFGFLPREFARTGGIAIATDWGGTADEISNWGIGINASLEPAWVGNKKLEGLGVWGNPDKQHLVDILRELTQRTDLNNLAAQYSTFVEEKYTWKKFAEASLRIYEEC